MLSGIKDHFDQIALLFVNSNILVTFFHLVAHHQLLLPLETDCLDRGGHRTGENVS